MYKKILICTDGSDFSAMAERHGVLLAQSTGADVVAVTVTPPVYAGLVGEAMAYAADLEVQAKQRAKQHLERIARACQACNVSAETVHVEDVQPHEGIVAVAAEKNCDLIVIGSHGWRGVQKLFLGSEAQKVMTHATVPVLVFRTAQAV